MWRRFPVHAVEGVVAVGRGPGLRDVAVGVGGISPVGDAAAGGAVGGVVIGVERRRQGFAIAVGQGVQGSEGKVSYRCGQVGDGAGKAARSFINYQRLK